MMHPLGMIIAIAKSNGVVNHQRSASAQRYDKEQGKEDA